MKGKLLFLIFIIIFVVAVVYTLLPPPEPTLALSRIYNTSLQPGQTIVINVTIQETTLFSNGIVSLQWDPYILRITEDPKGFCPPLSRVNYSIYQGPFLKNFSNNTKFGANKIDNTAGIIENLYFGIFEKEVSANGTGVLATINFTCINPGITSIDVIGPQAGHASLENINQESIQHEEVYGLVTADGPPPVWTELGFQTNVIYGEIIALTVVTIAIAIKRRPRSKREEKVEKEEEGIAL